MHFWLWRPVTAGRLELELSLRAGGPQKALPEWWRLVSAGWPGLSPRAGGPQKALPEWWRLVLADRWGSPLPGGRQALQEGRYLVPVGWLGPLTPVEMRRLHLRELLSA